MTEKEMLDIFHSLSRFDTPTICNAMECFPNCCKTEGFMDDTIHSVIACKETIIGRVATAKIATRKPATSKQQELWKPYYTHIREMGPECIVVQQDMDEKPCGSFWGEVNVTQHLALGCKGVVTNGGVRDLNEVEGMNFGYFAREVVVGHAYTHVEEVGCEVTVGGLKLRPGDIIACDRHGVVKIPEEFLPRMEEACRRIAAAELPVLEPCRRAVLKGETVSIEELMKWRADMARARKDAAF